MGNLEHLLLGFDGSVNVSQNLADLRNGILAVRESGGGTHGPAGFEIGEGFFIASELCQNTAVLKPYLPSILVIMKHFIPILHSFRKLAFGPTDLTHEHFVMVGMLDGLHLFGIMPCFCGTVVGDQELQEPEIITDIFRMLSSDRFVEGNKLCMVGKIPVGIRREKQ